MEPVTTWEGYYTVWERYKDRMLTLIRKFDPDADVSELDDYGVWGQIEREDKPNLNVCFSIWDSGNADDGIYGVHGNFILSLTEEGGRMVGDIIPCNYSDQVWVDYTNLEVWDERMQAIENSEENIREAIEKWRDE